MEALRNRIVEVIGESNKYRSNEVDQIVEALLKVQAEAPAPVKNKKGNRGPYADVFAMLDAVKPIASKHGILIYQHHRRDKGDIVVHSTLIHKSGQWLDSRLEANPIESDLTYFQDRSTAFTYTKRHLIQTQFAMGGDEE